MISPYLDRPLRSVAEAEAERLRGNRGGNDGAQDQAGTGSIRREQRNDRTQTRHGKGIFGRIRAPAPVIVDDDYG